MGLTNWLDNFLLKSHHSMNLTGLHAHKMVGAARSGLTIPQLTLLLVTLSAVVLSLSRHVKRLIGYGRVTRPLHYSKSEATVLNGQVSVVVSDEQQKDEKTGSKPSAPTLDDFLLAVIQLAVIMFCFYLSEYKKILPVEERVYSRDTFLFLVFLLFLVACAFTVKQTTDKLINRDQTEEWKGWMQVMFVWYHYYHAVEWYNWIRVYIAAYIWMTGFGNFSFFWIRGDYSLWRVSKMLFRLNFLVLLLCASVDNEYMLYYICVMHTYWFFSVYATMAIAPSLNCKRRWMFLKFSMYALANFIIFDVSTDVTDTIFKPLHVILGYHGNGRYGLMHEWTFRAGLDHWSCLLGMLCAYFYPNYEAFLCRVDSAPWKKRMTTRAVLVSGTLIVYAIWHTSVLPLEKFTYNAIHPYTSWAPVVCFLVLRNAHAYLRTHYIGLFAWLGRITLETYLSQLHLYLQANAKQLIGYLPGYPLLNFSVATVIYLFISHRLFKLTCLASSYLLPSAGQNQHTRIMMSGIVLAVATCVAGIISLVYNQRL